MMTMRLDNCPATLQVRRFIVRRKVNQEFAKSHGLPRQTNRVTVAGEQIASFLAKHAQTAWFKGYDWSAIAELRFQLAEDAAQISLGCAQQPEIIQRPSTTQDTIGNRDTKACILQHFGRGGCHLRIKVVV